jgi:mannose-6-phosphate isomerase-like protein (cupin superfamily)
MTPARAAIALDELSARIVRYADLVPCFNAFIDCRTPGSEAKENFTIIGPGVSENPAQYVHIAEPHGYNIGGARQPPGCVNSQHSHDTAEVFVAHSGQWRFDLGEHGRDAHVALFPGDVISIPTRMFRGFTATALADDGNPGFLFAVLGQDDPGRVTWAPQVFDMAKDYGLALLDTGQLIDTAAGQVIPDAAQIMPRTTAAQIADIHVPTRAEAESFVWRADSPGSEIIGSGAPINWHHGFKVSRFIMRSGQSFDAVTSGHQRVLFIHAGTLGLSWSGNNIDIGTGDTITIPAHFEHCLFSTTGCTVYEVGR